MHMLFANTAPFWYCGGGVQEQIPGSYGDTTVLCFFDCKSELSLDHLGLVVTWVTLYF